MIFMCEGRVLFGDGEAVRVEREGVEGGWVNKGGGWVSCACSSSIWLDPALDCGPRGVGGVRTQAQWDMADLLLLLGPQRHQPTCD